MRLEKLPTGIRITAEDEVFLDLTTAQYEDIYYALPLEAASLYLLMNGTVLAEPDDRAILQFIVEANGGVEQAMKSLEQLVQALPPPTATVQVEEKKVEEKAPVGKTVEAFDEPFELTVQPARPAVDPFADLIKPEKAEEKPFEAVVRIPPEVKTPPKPAASTQRPGTQVFEQKKQVPIVIGVQPDGKRVRITVGSKALDLGVVRYEDLYYAVPGDNASLFRLINDTILNRPEERDALKDILGLLGGIDTGMTVLQEAVQKCEPPPKKPKSTAPSVSGKPGSTVQATKPKTGAFRPQSSVNPGGQPQPKTGAFVSPVKPASTVQPAAGPSKPAVVPAVAAKGPVSTPTAPSLTGKSPVAPAATGSKPPLAPPQTGIKAPAVLTKPAGPASVPGKPAVPAGPRPFTVDVPDEVDEVEMVDDVEELPVAPVEARSGSAASKPSPVAAPGPKPTLPVSGVKSPASIAKPAGPVSKVVAPAAAPTTPAAASIARKKAKEIDRPSGISQIKMSKEDIDRTGVKVKAVPNVGYQIICKEYFIQLSKGQYQELHYALPMPVMNMFKLVHNDLLKDPGSRGVLMKMIHLAGGPKEFMSALSIQVQAIKPTEDWQ